MVKYETEHHKQIQNVSLYIMQAMTKHNLQLAILNSQWSKHLTTFL